MTRVRESNFDLLRILSAFAVVMLHVSAIFLQLNEIGITMNFHFSTIFLHVITRFAVPCFFMLSGAFILSDERNADYRYFYKKSIRNIGVTGVIFCLLYTLYDIAKLIAGIFFWLF